MNIDEQEQKFRENVDCQDLTESDDSLMNPAIEEAQNVENFECSSNINQGHSQNFDQSNNHNYSFQPGSNKTCNTNSYSMSHNVNTQKQNLSNYIDSPFEAENQYYQYSNNVDDKLHNNLFANNARYQSGLIDLNSTNSNSDFVHERYKKMALITFQINIIIVNDSPLSKNFKEVKRQLSVPRNKSSPLSKNFKEVKRQLSALNENYPPLSQNFNEDKRQLSVTYMTNESFSDYHDSDGITISNNQRLISIHDTTQMVNDSNMNLEFDPKYHFRDAIEAEQMIYAKYPNIQQKLVEAVQINLKTWKNLKRQYMFSTLITIEAYATTDETNKMNAQIGNLALNTFYNMFIDKEHDAHRLVKKHIKNVWEQGWFSSLFSMFNHQNLAMNFLLPNVTRCNKAEQLQINIYETWLEQSDLFNLQENDMHIPQPILSAKLHSSSRGCWCSVLGDANGAPPGTPILG
ncbi:696_t:CDS:2 [Ambispora leptoticha]|uniref:696_t:CDS:1 n=1 Tax=Ambispora leptoticha TaxID=144679 RepID=A0A9N9GIW6_9GLOM|nr:696_t:CDS:2 [Ambispora leptoticha]